MVTNWNSFDIGAGATVRFEQPGASSVALNRVTGGGAASSILGTLAANGNVWLLNPNGVMIGAGAQVDVGGLVASSLGISDSEFMAGGSRFTGSSSAGAVVNRGNIRTGAGGVVVLMAPQVSNSGSISTPGGSTVLAAGETVKLDFTGDGLISVAVERGALDAAAENSGSISAAGGLVALTARGADTLLGSVVNNTGSIEARGLVAREGRILLDGDAANGSTHVAGTLDASSATGKGGSVVVTGKAIALDNGATIDASGATGGGTVNVGGGWQGKDASIANATTVTADASVAVRADATGNGDGGKVVFWSDDTTRFAGSIAVRGGAQGGDGGKVEVSGKQTLVYDGTTDARAAKGTTGDLLLDPTTITVSGGAGTSGDYANGTGNVTVYAATLEAQNANVLLQATGNINFNDLNLNGGNGRLTMANDVSLRVEAGTTNFGDVTFANTANTIEVFGTGSLMFVAGRTGTGYLTNLPNLIAHGTGTNPVTLPSHDVTVVGSGAPGAGSITLYGADGVTVGGSVTTNGGYVRVWADSDNAGGGGYSMTAPVVTNGGNFYVSAGSGNIDLNSNMTLGTGRILFRADGRYTNGTRTLGGILSVNGPVSIDSPFVMNAGSGIYTDGAITFTSSVNLNTGAGALTLRASDIDFSSAALTNVSTASVILQPYDVATNIDLNGATTGIARASTFTKLAGIQNLTIGRVDGTGTTTVPTGGFAFSASNTLKLINGNIAIDGALSNSSTANTSKIVAQAGSGDVTLAATGSVAAAGTGDAVTLSAGRNFVNAAGPNALSTPSGRWLVYSTDALSDATGGLSNAFKQYNARYEGGAPTDVVQGAGNGFLYSKAPFINVALSGAASKTYDGNNGAALTGAAVSNVSGAVENDVVTFALGAGSVASYDSKNAGTVKQVNATDVTIASSTNGGIQVYGYRYNTVASGNFGVVDKRSLGGSTDLAATVDSKVYDGTTAATVSSIAVARRIAGDDLTASGTGTFDTRNAGGGKVVNVSSISYAGADAGNYDLTTAPTTTQSTGAITPKALTATASVASKVYDATTAASLSGVALVGVVPADAAGVTATGATGTFADKNAGSGKIVTGSGIGIAGSESSNYTFDTAAQIGTGTVTPRAIGASATVDNKVYDGTQTAAISNVAFRGVITGDTVTSDASSVGTFDTKNVGAGKVVSGSGIVLAGADAGNYAVDLLTAIGNASITPRTVTATATVTDKTYDGTTVAVLSGVTFAGVVAGDAIVSGASSVGAFDTKNVGAGKNVTGGGIVLTGADAGNYAVDTTTSIGTGNITPKALTATATVTDKVYDGTRRAALSNVALVGVVAGDQGVVGATGTNGTFADKNAGTGKVVAGSGVALSGNGASNYTFDATAQIGTAAITPKTITATADVAGKVYDGSTLASIGNVAFNGVVAGDTLTSGAGSVGAFDTKNAGSGKHVTGGGIVLTGTDAGNYRVDAGSTVGTGTITPKTLVVSGAQVSPKVYDGTTDAAVGALTLGGIVAGDRVSGTGASGRFDTSTVGADKNVTVSGLTLTGSDAGNYTVDSSVTSGRASIVSQQTAGTPVALIADPSGANATSTSSNTSGAALTQASATVATTAAATQASLVAIAVSATPAAGGQQVALNTGTQVQPLVLPDAVLTGNGRLSLAIDDGTARAPVLSTLAVYSTRSATQTVAQPEGQYEVSDRGNAIALTSAGAPTRTPPQVQLEGARTTTGSIALNDGGSVELRVALQSDNSLIVQVPSNGTGMEAEAITAYALTVAKKRFGIDAESVKAVVVQFAQRSAAAGAPTTVAGL